MYYCFKCTYCEREYCTYESGDKTRAANRLYKAIKGHLIEYDEDHKEYEMDDGEYEDSQQIYDEMSEQKELPDSSYEV